MQVRVLFFGALRDWSGCASDSLSLPEGATLGDVVSHYEQRIPKLKQFLPSIALSLNQQYAQTDSVLHDKDEVALLPPVSGGNSAAEREILPQRGFLVRERILTDELARALRRPEDGAVVVFEGVVRNNTRGRLTLYLDYEAYEAMAAQELHKLAVQACERFAVREVQIVHRLGRMEIGETSVAIIVCSAHRGAAFDACRWTIDTLKKIVPIWKKEYFEDGAVWADGEPFPDEIRASVKEHAKNGVD
ncbi:MAG TPA: molybdenum cofactor biosynthesis protein MoaE [Terriglobales bacterium]|nr:molybdenum cofactor biosynthesis protein MoaE [Terriglobales bacterium]